MIPKKFVCTEKCRYTEFRNNTETFSLYQKKLVLYQKNVDVPIVRLPNYEYKIEDILFYIDQTENFVLLPKKYLCTEKNWSYGYTRKISEYQISIYYRKIYYVPKKLVLPQKITIYRKFRYNTEQLYLTNFIIPENVDIRNYQFKI